MKNLKYILLAAIFAVFSCEDDFLEVVPETSIGTENFFNTEEDLNIYINSLYNFPGTGIYYNDRATDNAGTTGNTELKTMMVSTPSSTTVTGGWGWGTLRSVNLFLENFEKADLDQEKMDHFEGLARFFRANFYYGMVKRYSDVPYYDFVINTDDTEALMKARDPREFVVEKVFEDYQFAIDHVFVDQPDGAINNWVVKVYMARAALHEGTFRKYHTELGLQGTANEFLQMAEQITNDIINNGPFAIYNTGNVASDYGSLFTNANLNGNSEVIFAVYSEDQVRNSGWGETLFGNYEVSPAKDLVQAYLKSDGTSYTDQAGYESFDFVTEFEDRDPRMYQTFAFPGWENNNTRTYSQGGGIYVQQLAKNFTGYHQIKGFVNLTDQSYINSLDIPVLRFAEVLLINAEAKAELGNITQADLDRTINQLRDRAGMPHMTMGVSTDAYQSAKYAGISPLLAEIRRERRVELALEGYRHDDLMRWEAGKLIEAEPKGLYFSGLGKHDLTGDGIEDIVLLPADQSIPEDKEENSLGVQLVYYRAGSVGENVGVFLSEGTSGYVVATVERGTFDDPKFYYRPVPANQVRLNPNLTQIFGWD